MRVGILKGNGIGPEIVAATQQVIDTLGLGIEWVNVPIADEAVEKYGTEVPEESIDMLRELKVAIKGPISVKKMGDAFYIPERTDQAIFTAPTIMRSARSWIALRVPGQPEEFRGFPVRMQM